MAAEPYAEPYVEDISNRSDQQSIPQLIRTFTKETTALLQDEVDLAKQEVGEKIGKFSNGIIFLMLGGLVFFAGLLVLLDAAVIAVLPYIAPGQEWLAPLLVGGTVLIVGAILLFSGRSKMKAKNLKPERSLAEVRRYQGMFKERTT